MFINITLANLDMATAFRTGSTAAAGLAFLASFWGNKHAKLNQLKAQNKADSTAENQPAGEAKKATKTLAFRGGVSMIPHDEKVHKGGEDAFTASERLIAVADGVGGWANQGVDPGLFSKQLTKDIQALFNEKGSEMTLKEILVKAV